MDRTRDQFPLSIKKPIKKTVAKASMILFVFLLMLGIHLFLASSYNVPASEAFKLSFGWLDSMFIKFLALALVATAVYEYIYFQAYYYNISDEFVIIRKGVLNTTEVSIPYERIQDINVDQDFLDRIFGLYDVHFTSAGMGSEKTAHIDGVEKIVADELKKTVLELVTAKIKRAKG